MTIHKKIYKEGGSALVCANKILHNVICDSSRIYTNWIIEKCPECGMFVQTTGHSIETDKIIELVSPQG